MDEIDALVQQLTPDERVRLLEEIDRLLADANHRCDEQRGMRLSDLPQDIVVELFHTASHHFQALAYPDWWLLGIAGDAVGRQDWGLVQACLELFERRRVFYGLEACVLSSLWTALPTLAEELSDEDVHELIEEGDSDATTSTD
jgi:hypothetical protein